LFCGAKLRFFFQFCIKHIKLKEFSIKFNKNKMKKTISILALALLLGSFGCGEDSLEDTDDGITAGDVEVDVESGEVSEETSNPEIEQDLTTLESIITDSSTTSGDSSSIGDEELKKTCEQKFIYDEAVSTKDKGMCGELENVSDQETCVAEVEKE